MKKVTVKQAEAVLQEVALWLGHKGLGDIVCKEGRELDYLYRHANDNTICDNYKVSPAPTGPDAAYRGLGPELRMDFQPYWEGGQGEYPAIILEGGPYEWTIECSGAVQDALDAKGVNVLVEPATSWALGIFKP